MAEFFVWVTTRRIKEGALDDLRQAWEPPEPPEGMTRAFEWIGDLPPPGGPTSSVQTGSPSSRFAATLASATRTVAGSGR